MCVPWDESRVQQLTDYYARLMSNFYCGSAWVCVFILLQLTVNLRLLLVVKTSNSVNIIYSFGFLVLTVSMVPVSIGKTENVCGLWLLLVQWKK